MTIALLQKSLARTRKALPRASRSSSVANTAMTDGDQEEYLTSNSIEYQDESDSGSEFEQASDEGSATISDVDSDDDKSLPPARLALIKGKSKQSMASSEPADQEELEQAMLEAAIEESRQTAVQEGKLGQSSRGAGSSAAAPPLPDFDSDDLSELSDDEAPLKMEGKGKARGKGETTENWDDRATESQNWEEYDEIDAFELTERERVVLIRSANPVKVYQRTMAMKLGRKLTHASPFGFSRLDLSDISFRLRGRRLRSVCITLNCALSGEI